MLNTSTTPALEFKSSTFFSPILILFTNNIAAIEQTLHEKIKLAPEFFKDSPVIVDLRELNKSNQELDLTQIIDLLRGANRFPLSLSQALIEIAIGFLDGLQPAIGLLLQLGQRRLAAVFHEGKHACSAECAP